ncbi:hypothetical protein E3N88_36479 [Mikania micrantha]|uniref:very-long-chain 3-oxoacyl-CoA synthase n=1 Tax=Mikania micrantha TaxID=192012 RepID=A0A5N6M3W4_9ASTR|nr:hypothetical protein E3N88_36479 [Mikania micrantha]
MLQATNLSKMLKESAYKSGKTKQIFLRNLLDFMKRILERGGLGDSTYLSEVFFRTRYDPSMKDTRREVEMVGVWFSRHASGKNGISLKRTSSPYNLVGMGCSAGLLAIGLANQLLQVHHNSYALIVSTETITENFYYGKDRSKFLTNCLFRVGGAAILLSNRTSDHNNSKYQLLHAIHTNTSSSDRSYNCIFREEDTAGKLGITVTKDLLAAAIATIKPNITALGSIILPTNEKFRYLITSIARKLLPALNIQLYVPDYSNAVDHFLPHVGGKMVLDELQKSLGFSDDVMEASRMTLYRYGNTSSSSIWYELAYVEAKGRVRKRHRVWQISFGSGFKCNSVIWLAMKTVDQDGYNPWTDEIFEFPVTLENCEPVPLYFVPSK